MEVGGRPFKTVLQRPVSSLAQAADLLGPRRQHGLGSGEDRPRAERVHPMLLPLDRLDHRPIQSGPGRRAVVIGGGLIGLEAARGLQVQGCDVTVVHLMPTLMERQLDPDGGHYLVGKMEELGIRVLLGRTTVAVLGNGHAEGVALSDGSCLETDLLIVAAGIRPNIDLAIKAGRISAESA